MAARRHLIVLAIAVAPMAAGCQPEGPDAAVERPPFLFHDPYYFTEAEMNRLVLEYEKLSSTFGFSLRPGERIHRWGTRHGRVCDGAPSCRVRDEYRVACGGMFDPSCPLVLMRLYADLACSTRTCPEALRDGLAEVMVGGITAGSISHPVSDRTLDVEQMLLEDSSYLDSLTASGERWPGPVARLTAADFTGYLLRRYGVDGFLHVYANLREVGNSWSAVAGESLAHVVEEWRGSPAAQGRSWAWSPLVCSSPTLSPGAQKIDLAGLPRPYAPVFGSSGAIATRTIHVDSPALARLSVAPDSPTAVVSASAQNCGWHSKPTSHVDHSVWEVRPAMGVAWPFEPGTYAIAVFLRPFDGPESVLVELELEQ